MMNEELAKEVRVAERSVEQAEAAVAALLAQLTTTPRAEKISASAPLEAALRHLREAHAALAMLRTGED